MATSLRWQTPPSVLVRGLDSYKKRLIAAIGSLADLFAAKMESWMKTNAPWQDRTGAARAGLRSVAVKTATGVVLYLMTTVSYGVYLELANQGRFQVLLPTLQFHYGPLMAALRRLVGGR